MKYDLLIVGGGPVGAGLARAAQGLSVALLAHERRTATVRREGTFDARVYALSPANVAFLGLDEAALTPVHAIVLFGPETPRLFGPLSSSSTVIWKELACSPCVSVFNHRLSPCRNNVCMQSITVDEVFEAVQAAIRLKAGSTAETGGVRF